MGATTVCERIYDNKGYTILGSLEKYFNKNIKKEIEEVGYNKIKFLPDFIKYKLYKTEIDENNKDSEYDVFELYGNQELEYSYRVLEKDGIIYWEIPYATETYNGNTFVLYINILPESDIIKKDSRGLYKWTDYIFNFCIKGEFINNTVTGSKDIFGDVGQGVNNQTIKEDDIIKDLDGYELDTDSKLEIINNILYNKIDNARIDLSQSNNEQIINIIEKVERDYCDGIICSKCSFINYPEIKINYTGDIRDSIVTTFKCKHCKLENNKKIELLD